MYKLSSVISNSKKSSTNLQCFNSLNYIFGLHFEFRSKLFKLYYFASFDMFNEFLQFVFMFKVVFFSQTRFFDFNEIAPQLKLRFLFLFLFLQNFTLFDLSSRFPFFFFPLFFCSLFISLLVFLFSHKLHLFFILLSLLFFFQFKYVLFV